MSKARRLAAVTALATITLAFVACGDAADKRVATTDEAADTDAVTLRVMAFNIEWGGTHVRFAGVSEAIREAGADIVAIQEPEGNLPRLAADLGWHYNRRSYVISKYPLIDPPEGNGNYVYVEVLPGKVVAVASVHLPSDPYGPEWFRDGRSMGDVLALERELRLATIEPVLQALDSVQQSDFPVFLGGDFNAPSHEDWTEASLGTFEHRGVAVEWPASKATVDAGFRDAYRSAHPDPVAHPGFTWWAGRPPIEDYNPSDVTERDRIDFVWYAGPAELIDSELVGEQGADGVDIAIDPWPSDHRAVVAEFRTKPVAPPPLITTAKRIYSIGERVQIVYQAPCESGHSILLKHINEQSSVTPQIRLPAEGIFGRSWLPDEPLASGRFELSLIDGTGFAVSRNEFWIVDADATPVLQVGGTRHAIGEPIPFDWQHAPGNRNDWIGIFDARASNDSEEYLTYGYVGAQPSGRLLLGADTVADSWPLPAGNYVARLLLDDGFVILAESAPFAIE
jgi:endonuclease/exonuclease/phosphatase family metal-dependent hydrolase